MRRALPWIWGAIGIVAVVAIWELYKWLGPADGVVLGYVERIDGRYRSKRLVARATAFDVIGEFGVPDDAVESLRA